MYACVCWCVCIILLCMRINNDMRIHMHMHIIIHIHAKLLIDMFSVVCVPLCMTSYPVKIFCRRCMCMPLPSCILTWPMGCWIYHDDMDRDKINIRWQILGWLTAFDDGKSILTTIKDLSFMLVLVMAQTVSLPRCSLPRSSRGQVSGVHNSSSDNNDNNNDNDDIY